MNNFQRSFIPSIFNPDLYSGKHLFVYLNESSPSEYIFRRLDYERALKMLREIFSSEILQEMMQTAQDCGTRKEQEEESFFIMKGRIVLNLGFNYCCIFYDEKSDGLLLQQLKQRLQKMRKRTRRQPMEINLVVHNGKELFLSEMEVRRTSLDIDLYYEDDFREVDETIRKRLNQKHDKGIVLLHGTPGTGKTTYLRYLVGKIKKTVIFITPDIAGRMANPELIKLLTDNPNSVLIIEDAENIIMQRQPGCDSAVSNLLNISDGLLSDFLNIQLVCTFNSPLSTVDQALLRKGRLIAKYEFGKLSVAKARKLSEHLGHQNEILQPMTVAEIFNQKEKTYTKSRQLIGFRSPVQVS